MLDDLEDIKAALDKSQEAVDLTPEGDPQKSG
jgi:hypothetical protein